MYLIVAALEAYDAGLCVVPATSGKRPAVSWHEWQERRPTRDAIRNAMTHFVTNEGGEGFGIVCGQVSGNVEMFEFEARAVHMLPEFEQLMADNGFGKLWERINEGYRERTPSGGLHWLYRVVGTEVRGNTKLAATETNEVLIETRGEGGFVVTAPSGGNVHPSGGSWTLESGGFRHIATLSKEEYEALHAIARMLDKRPPREAAVERAASEVQGTGRPGDDFDARGPSWEEILLPHGWQIHHKGPDGAVYWTRPGKDPREGVSATTGVAGREYGKDYLWVFTTSTDLPSEQGLTKFAAYTYLNHGGDFSAAARDLAEQGYGARSDEVEVKERSHLGAAERLAPVVRGRIVYSEKSDTWYAYNERLGVWIRGAEVAAKALCVQELRRILNEELRQMKAAGASAEEIGKHRRFILDMQSRGGLAGAMDMLKGMVPANEDLFDVDTSLLAVKNGALHFLPNGGVELLPHSPEHMLTKCVPTAYNPGAKCPAWEAYLQRFHPDPELRAFLQRVSGASLTGAGARDKLVVLLDGPGGTGKSTFREGLIAALGREVLMEPDPASFTINPFRAGGAPRPDLVALAGARIAFVSEASKEFDAELLKRLSGSEPMTVRNLYKGNVTIPITFTLFISSNTPPVIDDTSAAFWNRAERIRFEVKAPTKRDPDYKDLDTTRAEFQAEAEGILAWLVDGYREYRKQGLNVPEKVRRDTDALHSETDPVLAFIQAEVVADPEGFVAQKRVAELFRDWHMREYPDAKPLPATEVRQRLQAHLGPPKRQVINGKRASQQGWAVKVLYEPKSILATLGA